MKQKLICALSHLSIKGLMSMTATTVKVNRALSVPPMPFDLPLVADPTHMVTVSPPAAHTGPGPVLMRLISYELREGQVQQFIPMSLTILISLE